MASRSALAVPRTQLRTRRRATAALLVVALAGLGAPLTAGPADAATHQAFLVLSEAVSNPTPYFDSLETFTTTVSNTSTTFRSFGVVVSLPFPRMFGPLTVTLSQGVIYPCCGHYSARWFLGSLAPGASATLTISGGAADVAAGTQTAVATVKAKTPDPNPTKTASASETTQAVQLDAKITPSPHNPATISAGEKGHVEWTGSAVNPTSPTPNAILRYTGQWSCATASGNPCPPAGGTDRHNIRTLRYPISALLPDTYTITFTVTGKGPNYTGSGSLSVTFTVSSGG